MKTDHPLQSAQWEEFRKKTGVKTLRVDGQLLTIHKIPYTSFNIGYIPKGELPNEKMINRLKKVGEEENCIFIQLEPNVLRTNNLSLITHNLGLRPAAHPLFTKYTFVLDITKNEEELMKNMHPKTRYNIKIAEKHGVEIVEDNSDKAFEEYLKLTFETTKRQGFFAHSKHYHRLMWETLKSKMAHLFTAKYKGKTLVAWVVFIYNDTLYYPYGASSSENRETMASNLMMWEVIKWGKNKGLKKFDMWGSLGPDPDEKDPWFGFHRFKQGYGPGLIEFVGSYDLVIKPFWYELYKLTDKIRWWLLKLK
jgi:lipid II:glycine glycyltransferase (peptidoglycan interpeptide bridge formation enzyme)